jgi:hypothetical protein
MNPRRHHYLFAHKVLPTVFYKNSTHFIYTLGINKLAQSLWYSVANDYIENKAEHLLADGLEVNLFKNDELIGVTFELPKAIALTEAIFIFAVTKRGDMNNKVNSKYFTLEYMENNGEAATVMCMWDMNKRHLNFGVGCEIDMNIFIERCIEKYNEINTDLASHTNKHSGRRMLKSIFSALYHRVKGGK